MSVEEIRLRAVAGDAGALGHLQKTRPHDYLVTRAVRWLRGTKRCGVVLAETIGGGYEQPDAIGWKLSGLHTVLVECKVSRSDFLRDKKKWHRRAGTGMGQERYYLAPPGVISVEDLPDGWGLAVAEPRRVRVLRPIKVERFDFDRTRREVALLYAALRKVELGLPMDRWHQQAEDA